MLDKSSHIAFLKFCVNWWISWNYINHSANVISADKQQNLHLTYAKTIWKIIHQNVVIDWLHLKKGRRGHPVHHRTVLALCARTCLGSHLDTGALDARICPQPPVVRARFTGQRRDRLRPTQVTESMFVQLQFFMCNSSTHSIRVTTSLVVLCIHAHRLFWANPEL